MIPGYQALGGIEEALAQLRASEADAHRRLDETMARMAQAKAEETDGFQRLAGIRLKGGDIGGPVGQVRTRVMAVLALRANDRTTLDKRLAAAEAEVKRLSDARVTLSAELAKAEEARRAVENEATVGLAATNDYAGLKAQAEQARAIAEATEKKAKRAEEELDQKRKPYEGDALFMYLWKRGYGRAEYDAGNIVRLLDGWVAQLIRFEDARRNYAMLTEITGRLREHANRAAGDAVELVEQLKALEKSAYLKAGGTTVDASVGAQTKRIDELDRERAKADAVQRSIEDEIAAFGRGTDPRYREAQAVLAEALASEQVETLYRQALATPTPEDEKVVQAIGGARDLQVRLAAQAAQIRDEFKAIAQRRQEVGQVANGFRQRQYDRDGSVFDNDVVGHLLRGILTGVLSGADYWGRMEQGRRGSSNWGGGGGSAWGPGPWSGGGGGSSSGGGSSGGSSGDGFDTGGRF
jgi:hypothetical protein